MSDKEPTKKTLYVNGVIVGEVEATGDIQKDMELARDFLKSKGLHKEVTMTQAMFRQALSFSTTAAYIHKRDLLKAPTNGLSVVPFVVNSAFSIELYLKTLLNLHGVAARGHSLLNLYDALPEEARGAVFDAAKRHAHEYQVKVSTQEEFRGFVAELDTAFVEWRYCYETGHAGIINIWPTILVMKAAHEACKKLGAT
ncbi:MAG: hypothetical protein HY313_01145 [Acidobacteria bacterium]|nr:hypothetical protein [Acidobacteriota bacterium]